MTSESSETTSTTFELTCNDCAFEATVDGDIFDALDVADTHQEKHGKAPLEHFVDFETN